MRNAVPPYVWEDGKVLCLGKKTAVMGILNVTPDSFSDGGQWNNPEKAVHHVEEMISDGADIIDVGAQSTRPGSTVLTAREEKERLFSFLPQVLRVSSVPVSVDTYHWETAQAAVKAGVHMLNDVWGFQYDQGDMARVAGDSGLPSVLMHNHEGHVYDRDIIEEIESFLSRSIEIALAHGVAEKHIILDPGIGFGKTGVQNMEILQRLDELTMRLPFPFLLGVSRKRFIGTVLDLPASERDEGTAAVSLWGQLKGCSILRVHNVKMTARMAKMTDALMGVRPWIELN